MQVGSSFDATAAIYDRSRRQLIPCFDQFYAAALALAPFPADAPLRVLDLGAGTGLLSSFFAARYANARFTLVDLAGEMLQLARRRLGEDMRFTYADGDLSEAVAEASPAYDLVISALAIHHLEDDAKRTLFARVYGALTSGGAFINGDQVLGRSTAATSRNHNAWLAGARGLGVSDGDLAAALERMAHDRMATLDDQLAWLEEAGFEDVDCAFKWGMFAVFSGRKASGEGAGASSES